MPDVIPGDLAWQSHLAADPHNDAMPNQPIDRKIKTMKFLFDILDLLEFASRSKGRIATASGIASFALLWGWAERWPIAYPLIQGALDARAAKMLEMFTPLMSGT